MFGKPSLIQQEIDRRKNRSYERRPRKESKRSEDDKEFSSEEKRFIKKFTGARMRVLNEVRKPKRAIDVRANIAKFRGGMG